MTFAEFVFFTGVILLAFATGGFLAALVVFVCIAALWALSGA